MARRNVLLTTEPTGTTTQMIEDERPRPMAPWRHDMPPDYPTDLEWDVTLDDLACEIRPIVPGDAEVLLEFHSRLSPESRYLRFFSFHPRLSSDELERFTHVDYRQRLALVALVGARIIGVGRYDQRAGTDEAEVAFVVADEFHRHGVASLLLDLLVAAARRRGITTFMANTMWENHDMLGVFLHSGFDVLRSCDGGVVTVRFPLRETAPSRAALAIRDANRQVTPHGETTGRGQA